MGVASCCGSPLAAASAPGTLPSGCSSAQPRAGGNGGPGRPQRQNPAASGDGSAGGCPSPAVAVPAMRCLGSQPCYGASSGAMPGCCHSSRLQPPNTQTREREGFRCIHPPGHLSLPLQRTSHLAALVPGADLGFPSGFFVPVLSEHGPGLTVRAREPKWHSVHGRQGRGRHSVHGQRGRRHHVPTRRSLICMCCSLELRLQPPPPSIPLCNYCQ